MGTVPYANPGGINQTAPTTASAAGAPKAYPLSSGTSVPGAIPGGSQPSTLNPYSFASGVGAVPGAVGSPTGTPTTTMPGTTGPNAQDSDLYKQWTDILGTGTGGSLFSFMQGLPGTQSDIFKQWLSSMQPQYNAAEQARKQSLSAGGVSPNSTINALSESNLQAEEVAQQGGVNAQLMQTNQADTMNILQNMQGLAAQQVVSDSPWATFGRIINAAGAIGGDIMGMAGGMGAVKGLFGGGGGGGTMAPQLSSLSPEMGGVPGGGGFMDVPQIPTSPLPEGFSFGGFPTVGGPSQSNFDFGSMP
jgi:hypothetical protein